MVRRYWAAARAPASALTAAFAVFCAGCGKANDGSAPALNKPADTEPPKIDVPADGPKLGALAELTPILERPVPGAKQIGYLHAGAKVPRAAEAYSKEGCAGGWYPIRPRGFVCAGEIATTDLNHPTLAAMALQPKLDQILPYTYARTTAETSIYERDPARENAVREAGKLRAKSSVAVVGSWQATDPEGKSQRLGMLTNGRFVAATDLSAGEQTDFKGVELNDKLELPVAFVVKRGVRYWKIDKAEAEKADKLDYHLTVPLTGRYREIDGLRYWAAVDGRFVRHRDVTVLRKRNVFPEFATADQKWVDVSVVTGTLVLYEGRQPVYATLCSVGRDRLGDPKTSASTALGVFDVVSKHVTAVGHDPKRIADYIDVYDLPWALELTSGQYLHGAAWHDRFGIEYGLGGVQLAPADAVRVWHWAEPALPDGWHGTTLPAGARKTVVYVRK